jgi:dolichyl-phosphate-mannose--protein O-mannosyl transferase
MPYQVMGSPDGKKEKKIGKPVKSRKYAAARAAELEDTHKKTGGKYRSQYVEELDIFDEVLEFLQVEGYAETLEEAEWMMANLIDEEAIEIILGEADSIAAMRERAAKRRQQRYGKQGGGGRDDFRPYTKADYERGEKTKKEEVEYVDEAQAARENPEKYEREQAKKSAPVRGERTPMPPRGDKRREDFEKWYAKQMGR